MDQQDREWQNLRRAVWALDSEVKAQRVIAALRNLAHAIRLEERYAADQPRVPAGSSDGGQWTSGGGQLTAVGTALAGVSGRDEGNNNSPATLVAGDGGGYPVNLLEEEALSAHIYERHIGASADYLIGRVREAQAEKNATNGPNQRSYDFIGRGSFTSLDAATKLVNATISRNKFKVDLVASGDLKSARLVSGFSSSTGYEAYASSQRSTPYIRPTNRVFVIIIHDDSVPKKYSLITAFPTTADW